MRTNEKRTTLHEWDDMNVKVRYFWAEDDKMTNCTDSVELPVGWLHAKVRLDLLEFTETFENLGLTKDFQASQLYINEEFIGEVFEVTIKEGEKAPYLLCDVIIGCG